MARRPIPAKLGQKLRQIREHLGLTMDELAEAIGRHDAGRRSRIHEWESGKRQPDLPSLLAYARLAGISSDALIDDELELNLDNPKGKAVE